MPWIRARFTQILGRDGGVMAIVNICPVSTKVGAHPDRIPRLSYDHYGSLFHYRRSLRWSGETRFLSGVCAVEEIPGSWLGQLGASLHHTQAHQYLDRLVSLTYRRLELGNDDDVRTNSIHDSFIAIFVFLFL